MLRTARIFGNFDDDERQNRCFKIALSGAKSKFFSLKRAHGLPAKVLPQEVLLVLRAAIMDSYLKTEFAQAALLCRGAYPFNRATLDDPQILVTASNKVQAERAAILKSRGINLSTAVRMPATQRNLLETGSGHLAGGMASANEVAEGLCSLNFTSATANNIMSLMQSSKNQNEARMKEMTDGTSPPSAEELKRRYAESKRMTSGTIFFKCDGILGTAVRDEVIQRNNLRRSKQRWMPSRTKLRRG